MRDVEKMGWTAEELRIIRDALLLAGSRRNRNGLDAGVHRRLAETFQAALAEGELVNALTSTLAPVGHSAGSVPTQWLSTREIAQRRGCSTRQARRIAQKIGRQIGTDWFIAEDSL
jgi:hypothetical protein